MSPVPPRSTAVDEFVSDVSLPLREIVATLRRTVREAGPELREEIVMGIPTYSLQGFVCYIAPYTRHVNLGFHRGAHFPNPPSILEGTGKGLRHVKVRTPEEARSLALRSLVQTAIANDRPLEHHSSKSRSRGVRSAGKK